jgi:iron-regulated transporter 1
VFKDTLVPASLVGFFTTGAGLVLSGYIGGKVDTTSRLGFVRCAIGCQKVRLRDHARKADV